MSWEEIKQDFTRIANEYEGEITVFPNTASIENENEITAHYKDGTVAIRKKTDCSVYVQSLSVGICLGALERTYAILGGCSGFTYSEEQVRKLLERYGFKKKKSVQLSIFDL